MTDYKAILKIINDVKRAEAPDFIDVTGEMINKIRKEEGLPPLDLKNYVWYRMSKNGIAEIETEE